PVTVLIGEAGMGKSTLLRAVLASEKCRHVQCVLIDNPTLTRAEFFETLAARFEITGRAETSKASLLDRLETILPERPAQRDGTPLGVDEAEAIPDEVLDNVRLPA